MIASPIPAATSGLALLLLVAMGCLSGCEQHNNTEAAADERLAEKPVAEMSLPSPASPSTGLTPLPTREQVLSSVPEGRTDPFAPTVISSSVEASQIDPNEASVPDLKVRGVVAVGAELRALVSLSEVSGTVCIGPRGRCPGDKAALLPIGWAVQSIDLGRGCLSFSISGESQRPRCIA